MDNSDEQYKRENLQVTSSFSDKRLKYYSMTLQGLMFARHQGVEMSCGEIISFIDDDSFVSKSWLHGVEQSFCNPIIGLTCGPNYPEYEITPPNWMDSFWCINDFGKYLGYLSLIDFGKKEQTIPVEFVWGCNYSIRKEIFTKVMGSHPDFLPKKYMKFQGDGETGLSVKVSSLGYKAMYSPSCAIQHWVPRERMDLNYWKNRAFFIGLHSSFTDIRRKNGLGESEGVPRLIFQDRGFRRYIPKPLRKLKREIWSHFPKGEEKCDDITVIRKCLDCAYIEGWNYHKNLVQNDPILLAYVLRPNFLGKNELIPE